MKRKLQVCFIIITVCFSGAFSYAQITASLNGLERVPLHNQERFLKTEKFLNTVLTELELKYKVSIAYKSELVKDKRVSVEDKTFGSLEEALTDILKPFGLVFKKAGDRFYVIEEKKPEKATEKIQIKEIEKNRPDLSLPQNLRISKFEIKPWVFEDADITVSGKVRSEERGEPLPGVNILLKGTALGTVTDMNGDYSINAPENGILVFSFIGYVAQEVPINNRSVIDITLAIDVRTLDEVVVIGYGTQKKMHLTGAVNMVASEQIEGRPLGSTTQALQGLVPNLNISPTDKGGEPGGRRILQIRGTGSISGDDSPYILVDGVPMDIENVNPEDIESVSVLKDAAASAIYGARGAFGVILITTKSGSKMNNATKIDYSGLMAWGAATRLPRQQTGLEAALAANTSAINSGQAPLYSDELLDRIKQYAAGQITDETRALNETDWDAGNANNDWPEILFGGWAPSQKHNISISGNKENTNFYLSGGFFSQDGQINFGSDLYERYNLISNIETDVTSWFDVDANIKYAKSTTSYPLAYFTHPREVNWHNMLRSTPSDPLYYPNGEINGNIALLRDGGRDKENRNDLWLGVGGTIEPVTGWVTRLTYNWNYNNNARERHNKTVYTLDPSGNPVAQTYPPPENGVIKSFENFNYHLFNAISSYEKDIKDHYFMVLVGYEEQLSEVSGVYLDKFALITDEVPSISTATGNSNVDDNMEHWSTQGFFARINYNYKGKYLLEFNSRYDGSSQFLGGKQWGLFPSAAIGYNISRENFWNPIQKFVNDLKIRASYGSLGNQGLGNEFNYQYIPIIPVRTNLSWIFDGKRPNYSLAPGLISNDLTWETVTTLNFGLDASFLNDKLNLTFDWYNRNTTDGHGPAEALPATLGASPPKKNNTELETKGFELILSWGEVLNADFAYDVKFLLSNSKSTVMSYHNPTGILTTYREGQVLGEIWGYSSAGYFKTENEDWVDQSFIYPTWGPGDMKYSDINGDGKIDIGNNTIDNSGDLSIIGNSMPQFLVGFSAGITWKGFGFNMFWQGVGKRDLVFSPTSNVFYGFVGSQQNSFLKEHLNFWSPEGSDFGGGPNAYYPKPYYTVEHIKNTQPQTKYMQNGAYLRLKTIQIGYTVPKSLTEKVFIKKARIYFSGENVFTITKLTKLFDPEAIGGSFGSGKIYPLQKVLSVGLNITL